MVIILLLLVLKAASWILDEHKSMTVQLDSEILELEGQTQKNCCEITSRKIQKILKFKISGYLLKQPVNLFICIQALV